MKKALTSLLLALLITTSFSVCSFAEETVTTISTNTTIDANYINTYHSNDYNFDNLTINDGVTLTLETFINVNKLIINGSGSVVINGTTEDGAEPNGIHVNENGSITLGSNSSLTGNNNHVLNIDSGVNLSGFKIYNGDTEISNTTKSVSCSYNSGDLKWYLNPEDVIIDSNTTITEYNNYGNLTITNGATLTINSFVDVFDLNIEDGHVVINGTESGNPNGFHVNENGSISLGEDSTIIANNGHVLDIESNVALSGIDVYKDGNSMGNHTTSHYICSYNSEDSSWNVDPQDMTIAEATTLSSYEYIGTLTVNSALTIDSFIDVNKLIINDGGSVVINGTGEGAEPNGIHIYGDDACVTLNGNASLTGNSGHVLDIESNATLTGINVYKAGKAITSPLEEHITCHYDSKWLVDAEDIVINNSTTIDEYKYIGTLTVKENQTLKIKNYIDVNKLIIEDGGVVEIDGTNNNSTNGIHIYGDGGSITLGTNADLYGIGDNHVLKIDSGSTIPAEFIYKYEKVVSTPTTEDLTCICNYIENPYWTVQTDFLRLENEILDNGWAYYIGNLTGDAAKEKIKDYLVTNFYNYYVYSENREENRGFKDMFTNLAVITDEEKTNIKTALRNCITLSELSDSNDPDNLQVKDNAAGNEIELRYYVCKFEYEDGSDTVDFEFPVYVLNSDKDFIFSYVVDDEREFVKFTGGTNLSTVNYLTVPSDADDYYAFGNGIADEGQTRMADGQTDKYHVALQLATTNSNVKTTTEIDDKVTPPETNPAGVASTLVVYKNNFLGMKVGATNYAASWAFANFPVYSVNDNSVATVFYKNDSVEIKIPENSPCTITNVVFSNGKKSMNEATITDDGNGTYTITFGSIFYDTLKIKISYSNGSTKSATINRVGLHIAEDTGVQNQKIKVYHGTDHLCEYSTAYSNAIYASYYYTSKPNSNDRVKLFVTLTYEDGTKETKVVSHKNTDIIDGTEEGHEFQGNSGKYADDFILWEGSDNMPVKVEAIVYIEGNNNTTFGGVTLGNGTGVTWENN